MIQSPSRSRTRVTWQRYVAAASAVCAVTGAVAIVVAVVGGPGPGLSGYVSEAGISSSPYAAVYRGGVFGLAACLLMLAAALPAAPADELPGGAVLGSLMSSRLPAVVRSAAQLPVVRLIIGLLTGARAASALLVAGAVATAVSGTVSCSDGCPLPPYDRVTVADLVHGGASIAAVAACVFAMLAVALTTVDPVRLRVSVTAAAVALPLSAAVGLAMLTQGRGTTVGLLERLLLADIVWWAVCLATVLALSRSRP
ncbi:DUF998 domain-containing protein [Plantactinospora sp. GCM10030261]|uniref:DUF998 domain-containing protein n=1 Tax=Plantactinospora sp. GCM10030261 TaxID=3273420 RepID=UPI00360C2379